VRATAVFHAAGINKQAGGRSREMADIDTAAQEVLFFVRLVQETAGRSEEQICKDCVKRLEDEERVELVRMIKKMLGDPRTP
jgi:hypothetical protein